MQFRIFSIINVLVIAISAMPANSAANTGSVVVQPIPNKEASQKTSALKVAGYTIGAMGVGGSLVYAGYKIPQMLGNGKPQESMNVPGKNSHVS